MAKEVGIRVTANADPAIRAFDETNKTMQSVARTARTLTNDGADVEKILEKIGERGGQAFQELIAAQQSEGKSLKEIQKAVIELSQEQGKAARQAKADYVAEAQAAAVLQQREMERRKNLADGLTALAGRMREWNSTLTDAGHELENLQRQATLAFGDAQIADGVVAAIRNLDDQVQISEQSLLQAAVTLQKFGIYSDENLQRAAIAARKTGQSIEEVATGLGKFERFGDTRSRTSLLKMLGITAEQMNEAGSILDAMDAKFGTTTEGMASNAQLLQGEVGDAMQELGKAVTEASNAIAGEMLPGVQALHQKLGTLTHGELEVAGAIALSTTAVTGIIGAIGSYQLALVTLSEAQVASIATTAKFTFAISVATAAVALLIMREKELEENRKAVAAQEKERNDEALAATQALSEWSGKTTEELIKLGVTREQVLKAARGSSLIGADFNSRGNAEAAKAYYEQAEALRNIAIEMGNKHRAESEANTASSKFLEQQREAYKRFQTEVQLGHYKTKDEQQKALEGMVAQTLLAVGTMSESHRKQAMDFVDTLNIAIKRLGDGQKTAVADVAKTAASAAAEKLRAALDAIEIEDARDGLSHEQKIERLQRILAITGITAEQRIEIEKRVAKEQGAVREEATKAEEARIAKIAEAEAKAAQEKEAAAQQLRRKNKEIYGETLDEQIAAVEQEAKSYRDKGLDSVEIERYRTGAIAKIREDAAAKDRRATEDQNKGLERTNDLLDEQKKKRDALTFKQGSQSIQEAFGSGNFGFTLDTGLIGKMTTGQEQPKIGPASTPTFSNVDTSAGIVRSVAASQATSAASATSANTIVINAQNVTVNGQQRSASAASAAIDREGFFAR